VVRKAEGGGGLARWPLHLVPSRYDIQETNKRRQITFVREHESTGRAVCSGGEVIPYLKFENVISNGFDLLIGSLDI
jgi:hypothetical protein